MPKKRVTRRNQHRVFLYSNRSHYLPLLQTQGGVCAICGNPPSQRRRLDMDHDHKTMQIRGLLCFRCNKNLPRWATPEWLRSAADYLENPPNEA